MKAKKPLYFDYAAATPVDSKVIQAMEPYWSDQYYNPSSLYHAARQIKQAMEQSRSQIADVLGAKKSEIIFTAGGTESINLAVLGVARKFPGAGIVATAIEHDGVLACLDQLERESHPVRLVSPKPSGLTDVAQLVSEINDQTVLVCVMYANNELGTIQPISRIASEIKRIRIDRASRGVDLPLYLYTDASQAAAYLDMHVSRLGVDLMTINGGKIYGPKQSGCLYVRTGTQVEPIVYGGGQERGLRSGTENPAFAIGLALALQIAQDQRISEQKRLAELRQQLLMALKNIDGISVNADPKKALPTHLNISILGIDGETAVYQLEQAGFLVSTGSACSTGNAEPSHVLLAIGLGVHQANSSLRITLGRQTQVADIDSLASAIKQLCKQ